MREPKVLFIYPPFQLDPIEIARPHGAINFPCLTGSLRSIGIEAYILDANVGTEEDSLEDTFLRREMQPNGLIKIGMSWERIRQVIAARGYNIVGIDCMFTPQTRMALRIAQICKEINPEILVLAGGVNARNLPNWFLKDGWIDLICLTEGEKIIQDVVTRFMRDESVEGIPGTLFKGKNGVKAFPKNEDTITTNLDDLALPAWDKLPLLKYRRVASPHAIDYVDGQVTYAPVETSRGCPYLCTYCHISKDKNTRKRLVGDIGTLRLKSPKRVLEEFDRLAALGVEKVYIEDDSLLAKKKRVQEIFRALAERNLKIADVNGVNIVHLFKQASGGGLEPDKEYLEILKAGGMHQLLLPIESGSQRILDKYATGKVNLAIHDVEKLFRIATREVGIVVPTNIMIGFPDETEEEMWQSVEMAKRLIQAGAVSATFFHPVPYPGSMLWNMSIRGTIQNGVRMRHLDPNIDPDKFNWKHPVLINTLVPPARVAQIFQESWWGINPPEYVIRRTEESIGHRWQSGAPDKK
jgi:radical SAM superfamily enzyme YgiQ (UPF0313 family)